MFYLFICITMPGVQNPHCVALKRDRRSWIGWISASFPNPSTVVISQPLQFKTGARHYSKKIEYQTFYTKIFCYIFTNFLNVLS